MRGRVHRCGDVSTDAGGHICPERRRPRSQRALTRAQIRLTGESGGRLLSLHEPSPVSVSVGTEDGQIADGISFGELRPRENVKVTDG